MQSLPIEQRRVRFAVFPLSLRELRHFQVAATLDCVSCGSKCHVAGLSDARCILAAFCAFLFPKCLRTEVPKQFML